MPCQFGLSSATDPEPAVLSLFLARLGIIVDDTDVVPAMRNKQEDMVVDDTDVVPAMRNKQEDMVEDDTDVVPAMRNKQEDMVGATQGDFGQNKW